MIRFGLDDHIAGAIYQCRSCGVLWNPKHLKTEHYASGLYREICPEPENAHSDLIPLRLMSLQGLKYHRARVLDVGAGNGLVSRAMAVMTEGVVDVVEPRMMYWPGYLGQIGRCFSHLDEIEQPDGYDIITLFDVIEHVSEPRRLIDTLMGVASRDAVFILSTPHGDCHSPPDRFFRSQHAWYFTPASLAGLFDGRSMETEVLDVGGMDQFYMRAFVS